MAFTARVISTAEWGATAPKQRAAETTPRFIVVHHTDTPNPPADISNGTEDGAKRLARSIQNTHMNVFGWDDSGHNFLNTTGGFLLEGRHGSLATIQRGRSIRSSHAGNIVGNESPGIENEGRFMTQVMGQRQWNSLVELCVSICSSANISPDNIKGHRDFSATLCPGDWLYSQLPRLRQEVRQRLADRARQAETTLRIGSTGTRVTQLQQLLTDRGFNPGTIDGVFGAATEAAVRAFQQSRGLVVDGIVGEQTWATLTAPPPSPVTPPTPINPQPPMTSQPPVITTPPETTTPAPISLINVARFYRGLPHQDEALEWLQRQIPHATLDEFARRWRNQT